MHIRYNETNDLWEYLSATGPDVWSTLPIAAAQIVGGLSSAYPVGSIYINAAVATNPATLLGFGTWAAFGTGRVLVGLDSGQTEFDTLGETGGTKTHTLATGELPVHSHSLTMNSHVHTYTPQNFMAGAGAVSGSSAGIKADRPNSSSSNSTTGPSASTDGAVSTGTVGNAGSGSAHNNLQPYITVYMWQRTA